MATITFIIAIIFLACADFIVVVNWGYVLSSLRNKWRGIDRSYSTIPLVSLILLILADIVSLSPVISSSVLKWMALFTLLDIGNWLLVALPFMLIVIGVKRIFKSTGREEDDAGKPEEVKLH